MVASQDVEKAFRTMQHTHRKKTSRQSRALSRRVKPTSTTGPRGMKAVGTPKSAWGRLEWLYSKSPTAESVPDVRQQATG